ncbi:alpha/beta hydrolase fold protein [Mycolicibacterium canariasense]|uniref:Alpha/beta hydrolase fold protein n=1 Tax=Mycolicibacterium canariasense TaxID=228230 RepID=A0A117I9S9_MYCCR|nr:alpha/beta hydrolase [Mycolicibacterium canariasense]GAS95225.1 alpha/beta hydrolase fold protein [Mycolicibacterium canariasense]
MPERSTVDLPGATVSYLEWAARRPASGLTVVLLHGGGLDNAALSWGEIGPRLAAAGHRVVAPDHPGYGRSPAASWRATQQRLVDYVGEFTDALDLGPHVTGGLSLGGGMTIGHALARPGSVTAAMLLGSYGLMPRLSDGPFSGPRQVLTWALLRTGLLTTLSRGVARHRWMLERSMAALVRDATRRTPELLDEVSAAARSDDAFAAFEQWQRDQVRCTGLRTDYRDRLADIAVPVLVVHGGSDSAVPVAHAHDAAAAIPAATLDVVAGAGHWVQRDQPDLVGSIMLSFLGRLGTGS